MVKVGIEIEVVTEEEDMIIMDLMTGREMIGRRENILIMMTRLGINSSRTQRDS
jgi:hypothetical protein